MLNVQSKFRSLSVYLFDVMPQGLHRLHLRGQGHITDQDWQMLKAKRLFGECDYEFYIGIFSGISAFQHIMDTNTQGPKDFVQDKVWSPTQPPHLLAERMMVPLVHHTNKSPNAHQHAVHFSKLDYLSDHGELSELHKEVQLPQNDNNMHLLYLWGLL